jgi:Tfp pilus assembly protein PilX
MKTRNTNKSGFALLLALIVSSVVLAIGVSILNISVNQINLASTARESEVAFQAAHAGIDCMWYWRYKRTNNFLSNRNTNPVAQTVACFESNSISQTATQPVKSSAGYVNKFTNKFQWGTPARCTEVTLIVMNAETADLTYNVGNTAIGNNGSKRCTMGGICNILISDGYNRACNEVDSSIFSTQREIAVEF